MTGDNQLTFRKSFQEFFMVVGSIKQKISVFSPIVTQYHVLLHYNTDNLAPTPAQLQHLHMLRQL